MYQPIHPLRSSTLPLRRLTYHVNHWGPEQSPLPPLVLLHGWMDVGASYQFTVDALRQQRRILAPDWRGFGQTSTPQADHYVFADYLADLDMLLDHYAPGQAVDLVGHSMGGNVAMMYAGVRPVRTWPGLPIPLADPRAQHIDLVLVRENTEGEYSAIGGRLFEGTERETVLQESVFTRKGVDRILRFAFDLARQRPKKHLTSATKSNGMAIVMPYWDERVKAMAAQLAQVPLFLQDLLQAFEQLGTNDVPDDGQRFAVIGWRQWRSTQMSR